MKDGFYEVGEEVYLTTYATKERMIVEQVYRFGQKPHYVCSFADQPWYPQTLPHDELKPWGK